MTQQYTPVTWQDETTSQQGTLINAERLNQMQQAHHFADGFEEVDAVPTANPGVGYHKIVYCTADSTIYRWDGTEWTKDIDDETKALLEQEIARATEAEGELAQSIENEATARETADSAMQADISDLGDAIEAEETARGQADTALGTRITNETSARETADTALGNRIIAEATARADADTALGGRIDTEQARAEAAEQANAQAIANTYTKAEADTLLAGKASTSTVQTLDTRVGALETGLADTYNKSQTDTLLASKLDTLSTTGLHTYTHNGATQSEVSVIDGTTASTIPIRDANGRMQAADPASGATDKTLVTANWVSQTGDSGPNNLVHRTGNETIANEKTFTGIGTNKKLNYDPALRPGSYVGIYPAILRDVNNNDVIRHRIDRGINWSGAGWQIYASNNAGTKKSVILNMYVNHANGDCSLRISTTTGNTVTLASWNDPDLKDV